MCPPTRYFELNGDDHITIMSDIDEEKCTICGGNFKHTRKYGMIEDENGLREVIFKTAHNGCLKIMARIRAKRREITDLEYKIFCKSIV